MSDSIKDNYVTYDDVQGIIKSVVNPIVESVKELSAKIERWHEHNTELEKKVNSIELSQKSQFESYRTVFENINTGFKKSVEDNEKLKARVERIEENHKIEAKVNESEQKDKDRKTQRLGIWMGVAGTLGAAFLALVAAVIVQTIK